MAIKSSEVAAFVHATEQWIADFGVRDERRKAVQHALDAAYLDTPINAHDFSTQLRVIGEYFHLNKIETMSSSQISPMKFMEFTWIFLNSPAFWEGLLRQAHEGVANDWMDSLPQGELHGAHMRDERLHNAAHAFSNRTIRFQGVAMIGLGLAALLGEGVRDVIKTDDFTAKAAVEKIGKAFGTRAESPEDLYNRYKAILSGEKDVDAIAAMGVEAYQYRGGTCSEINFSREAIRVFGQAMQQPKYHDLFIRQVAA